MKQKNRGSLERPEQPPKTSHSRVLPCRLRQLLQFPGCRGRLALDLDQRESAWAAPLSGGDRGGDAVAQARSIPEREPRLVRDGDEVGRAVRGDAPGRRQRLAKPVELGRATQLG